MRASGVLGSCNRKTGRLGTNYLSTNTHLDGRIKKKPKPNTNHTWPQQSRKKPGSIIWSPENTETENKYSKILTMPKLQSTILLPQELIWLLQIRNIHGSMNNHRQTKFRLTNSYSFL